MYFPTPPLLPVPLADPVALPENPYELEHLRGDIKRWLEEREAEGIELKRTLNVFLAHVEAFKAGRLLDLPDVPAFMEERERASLYTVWEWPIWAACRFNSEDCEQVAGFDQQSRFFVQELADLLNEPKPDTCQAARLSYHIVEAQRAQAVSPMQRLLHRVTAQLQELQRRKRTDKTGADARTAKRTPEKKLPQNDDVTKLAKLIINEYRHNKPPFRSMAQIAREFTGEAAGKDRPAQSLLRKMRDFTALMSMVNEAKAAGVRADT